MSTLPRLVLLDPAIRIPPHVALYAAENARKERAYVSFDEGVERRYAAERALARLYPRKLDTRKCPVLFEAPVAAGLLGVFVQAVSGGASLTFTHETWADLHSQVEQKYPTEMIVCWHHTHPGFGVFLSGYDQFIHRNFFPEPWQIALVVDPRRAAALAVQPPLRPLPRPPARGGRPRAGAARARSRTSPRRRWFRPAP